LSSALAATRAMSMVRLLVSMMRVITATLVMLWKGRGHWGVALRTKEEAATQAAKVITSDMMNSHMANFVEGMTKGRASIGGAECAPMLKCASLTMPPVLQGLEPHPPQQKKIHPENDPEVPVIRKAVERAAPQGDPVQLPYHVGQAAKPAQHVQRVDRRQQIEE